MVVLKGNDFPYEGCNTIGVAKRQRNILRDYFMNDGSSPVQWPAVKNENIVIL